MARTKSIGIRKVLASLLPRRQLRLAEEVGLTRRKRKVQVHPLFWTLVLGFGAGRGRTIAGLRRAYERVTGCQLVPSAFYDRFTPALVLFLQTVVGLLIARVAEPTRLLAGPLASFRDLVFTDSTVIRLHDLLRKAFPACRTNHTQAALKLHTVMSANRRGAALDQDHRRGRARRADLHCRQVGQGSAASVRSRLLPIPAVLLHRAQRRLLHRPTQEER